MVSYTLFFPVYETSEERLISIGNPHIPESVQQEALHNFVVVAAGTVLALEDAQQLHIVVAVHRLLMHCIEEVAHS